MKTYQRAFIELALKYQALKFGEFTLKSGRVSPYFFNMGAFADGAALAAIGQFYAEAICDAGVDFDLLFGPAYKGIPLVATTAIALHESQQQNWPYAFNRKEAKDHGEGGNIVGAPLTGRVLVIDDVITAGTAIRESVTLIENAGASLAGVVICLDRQEKGQGELSAVAEVEQQFTVPVISIVSVNELLAYLEETGEKSEAQAVAAYQASYGA